MILVIDINQTASSGAWSFNTQKFQSASNAYLEYIVVKTTTATKSFDFYIQDDSKNDNLPYDTRVTGSSPVGTLCEEVRIPLVGIYTVGVVNAEEDAAFTGRLYIREIEGGMR